MIVLLDTSALAKLLVAESESNRLRARLVELAPSSRLTISSLAVTELRRLTIRLGAPAEKALEVVDRFDVLRLSEPVLHQAATFPQRHMGTLDAIHLATAIAVSADLLLTYDARLGEATVQEGMDVESPGRQLGAVGRGQR